MMNKTFLIDEQAVPEGEFVSSMRISIFITCYEDGEPSSKEYRSRIKTVNRRLEDGEEVELMGRRFKVSNGEDEKSYPRT